ncbi:hypothetical protein NESM_000904400 [Novymonas esmeraldas]|uniref:Uncharacterized protein n=1 Tax=Novymonas esmeraldas TaxID=1808958 RepID=A0AAW0EZK0_9TRYP
MRSRRGGSAVTWGCRCAIERRADQSMDEGGVEVEEALSHRGTASFVAARRHVSDPRQRPLVQCRPDARCCIGRPCIKSASQRRVLLSQLSQLLLVRRQRRGVCRGSGPSSVIAAGGVWYRAARLCESSAQCCQLCLQVTHHVGRVRRRLGVAGSGSRTVRSLAGGAGGKRRRQRRRGSDAVHGVAQRRARLQHRPRRLLCEHHTRPHRALRLGKLSEPAVSAAVLAARRTGGDVGEEAATHTAQRRRRRWRGVVLRAQRPALTACPLRCAGGGEAVAVALDG